jgi:hypothetical protein
MHPQFSFPLCALCVLCVSAVLPGFKEGEMSWNTQGSQSLMGKMLRISRCRAILGDTGTLATHTVVCPVGGTACAVIDACWKRDDCMTAHGSEGH